MKLKSHWVTPKDFRCTWITKGMCIYNKDISIVFVRQYTATVSNTLMSVKVIAMLKNEFKEYKYTYHYSRFPLDSTDYINNIIINDAGNLETLLNNGGFYDGRSSDSKFKIYYELADSINKFYLTGKFKLPE